MECVVAALAYLLPLAGGLCCARPLLAASPTLARACAPLALVVAPLSSPLGLALASVWLLCGVFDRRTVQSYFVRYNFCQALLLGALVTLVGLPCLVTSQASRTVLGGRLALSGWALGVAVVAWAWPAACCLAGRFPDKIPAISAAVNRQVKW